MSAVTMKRLTMEQLDAILTLQRVVHESLDDPTVLQPLDEEEWTYLFSKSGAIGLYDQEELIAVRAYLMPPSDDPDHLGQFVGLPEEYWPGVAYHEISFVHPNYQGNGYQKMLGEALWHELEQTDVLYVCATVAPHNIPSLLDKFHQGFLLHALVTIYGGKRRYVFGRPLRHVPIQTEETTSVSIDDVADIADLLDEGWKGIALDRHDGHVTLRFARIR